VINGTATISNPPPGKARIWLKNRFGSTTRTPGAAIVMIKEGETTQYSFGNRGPCVIVPIEIDRSLDPVTTNHIRVHFLDPTSRVGFEASPHSSNAFIAKDVPPGKYDLVTQVIRKNEILSHTTNRVTIPKAAPDQTIKLPSVYLKMQSP
jgi:hypothetical protein